MPIFNVYIKTENEILTTDTFYYNKEKHYLNYHIPHADGDKWQTLNNICCEIILDKPFILIKVLPLE